MPFQPPLVRLINFSNKGCNKWVRLLKRLEFSNVSLQQKERKWERDLGVMQGIKFWENNHLLTKTIFYDNKLKWFHYQVVRGTLKTNKIISKFIPGILSECTFCNLSTESILHLLWQSQVTNTFINYVYALFINK